MKFIYQFLIATCLMILALQGVSFADEPALDCTVSRGCYSSAKLLYSWNSTVNANPFPEFKYYGVYEDDTVFVIWGVNIGAGASASSRDRFQILASVRQNGVYSDIRTSADTDAKRPIDMALYVPVSNVSIRCKAQ